MSNEQLWRDPARTKTFYMHSGERLHQVARSHQKSMLVCKILSIDLNAARSRPKDTTKMFVSLIVDVVDPPQTRSRYPVMSPALEQAFSEIEKGAEEQLEVLWSKKECVEAGEVSAESVPKLIGHVEKVEEEDLDEQMGQTEGGHPAAEKEVGGGLTADREVAVAGEAGGEQMTERTDTDKSAKPTEKAEASDSSRRKQRSTPLISRMKEERKWAMIKKQEKRWWEATASGLGEILAGELDLEDAMLSPEESDKQQTSGKDKTEEEEGYGKVYTKTHKKRAERSLLRLERKEQEEEHKRQETTQKEAQEVADRMAQEEAKHVIERAQLEEEELAVQKRLEHKRKIQEMVDERDKDTEVGEGSVPVKVSATSNKQWKEHLGLKAQKCRRDEVEEEYVEPDDEDKDPDYNPTKDPEQEFEEEDTYLDDKETFEIEKHVHAINLQ